MLFKDIPLKQWLLKWILETWYTEATEIQQKVIPAALAWKNIVGQSQTWTGKTAAFLLPILNKIDTNLVWIQALILAPTRELVVQINDEIYNLTKYYRVPTAPIFGWVSEVNQIVQIKRNPRILVATPGRLIDFINQWLIDFSNIKYFVLDEVDRMLDMWFLKDIKTIWDKVTAMEQLYCFSATLNNGIINVIESYVKDYELIKTWWEITVDKLNHGYIMVDNKDKFLNLMKLLNINKEDKIVIFANTKANCSQIYKTLLDEQIKVWMLSWDVAQSKRLSTLDNFTKWKIKILVTTDVAARWLNMDNVWIVVNFDVPQEAENYIHRVGRTARAWASWEAIMFVDPKEKFNLEKIQTQYNIKIPKSTFRQVVDTNATYCHLVWDGSVSKWLLRWWNLQKMRSNVNRKSNNFDTEHGFGWDSSWWFDKIKRFGDRVSKDNKAKRNSGRWRR